MYLFLALLLFRVYWHVVTIHHIPGLLFTYLFFIFLKKPVLAAAPDRFLASYTIHFSYHFIFPYRTNPLRSPIFLYQGKTLYIHVTGHLWLFLHPSRRTFFL